MPVPRTMILIKSKVDGVFPQSKLQCSKIADVTFLGMHALVNTQQPDNGENSNRKLETVSFKHETCKKVAAIAVIFADRSRQRPRCNGRTGKKSHPSSAVTVSSRSRSRT